MATWHLQDVADRFPHKAKPLIGCDEAGLRQSLVSLARERPPRVITVSILSITDWLQVGLGGEWAYVECGSHNPWKAYIAVPSSQRHGRLVPESVWFSLGGDAGEIPAKYLMPVADAIDLVAEHYRQGAMSQRIEWDLS
jgi:hypothetical protein